MKKILHHYLAKGKGQKTVGIPVLPAPLFLLIAGQLVLSTSLFKCSLFRFNYINFPHLGSEGNFKKKSSARKKTPRKRPGRNFLPLCLACSNPQQSVSSLSSRKRCRKRGREGSRPYSLTLVFKYCGGRRRALCAVLNRRVGGGSFGALFSSRYRLNGGLQVGLFERIDIPQLVPQ